MSKEIEEMAKIMCQDAGTKNCNIRCNAHPICDVYFYADRLYREGYRKQNERDAAYDEQTETLEDLQAREERFGL